MHDKYRRSQTRRAPRSRIIRKRDGPASLRNVIVTACPDGVVAR